MKSGMIKSMYISWLKNDKQIIFGLLLICLYMYVISPLIICSENMEQPLCFIEPYMSFVGNGFCMPLVVMAFLITIMDFPDISGNITFVLHRCGKRKWYHNQLAFLIISILTFLALLFIFSVIFTGSISFMTNGWSNTMINLNNEYIEEYDNLRNMYPLAVTDLSIINHFRPYDAAVYNTILVTLMLTFHGQLQMCLSVRFNKGVGCIASISVLGLGLLTWAASSKLKWIFPLANSTIGWHYNRLFQETIYPIYMSFIYMILINIMIYIIGRFIIKRKQFYLGGETYD